MHIQGIPQIFWCQYIQKSSSSSPPASVPPPLNIQHVVEVGHVTDRESQDLDLGQLLVRWERRQQLPQLRKGHVEGQHAHPLPGGVRGSIFRGRAPLASLLLSAEGGHVHRARSALCVLGHVECVQEGLRVRVRMSPGQVGPGLVWTEHHVSVLRPERP